MAFLDIVRRMAPELVEREERRQEIGEAYGLELTTAPSSAAYTPWTDGRLDLAESAFDHIPAEHLDYLERVQLGGLETEAGGEYRPGSPGLVKLDGSPDRFQSLKASYGCTSELAGHQEPLSQLEHILVHEVGHLVASEIHPEAAAQLYAAAGWVDKGGQWSEMVRPTDDFVPTEPARCGPDGAPMSPDELYSTWDSWDYARSGHEDYFAEVYSKAVNLPESLHADLIARPALAVEEAEKAGMPAAEVARRRRAAAQMRLQWDIMREQVFGVDDDMVQDRVGDLEALGSWSSPAEMEAARLRFEADAAKAMTPDQLERLLDRYLHEDEREDAIAIED